MGNIAKINLFTNISTLSAFLKPKRRAVYSKRQSIVPIGYSCLNGQVADGLHFAIRKQNSTSLESLGTVNLAKTTRTCRKYSNPKGFHNIAFYFQEKYLPIERI